MLLHLTFTTPSMALFIAVFGSSAVLAPEPKYAASAKFHILAPYANLFLDMCGPEVKLKGYLTLLNKGDKIR